MGDPYSYSHAKHHFDVFSGCVTLEKTCVISRYGRMLKHIFFSPKLTKKLKTVMHNFFKFGFPPCKAEQPLQGMQLKENEAQKVKAYRKSV